MKSYDKYLGKRFGRLTLLYFTVYKRSASVARCQCVCGAIVDIAIANIVKKLKSPTRSCGCLRREVSSKAAQLYHWRKRYVTYQGKTYRLYELAKMFKINYETLHSRLRTRSVEEALAMPRKNYPVRAKRVSNLSS